MTSRVPDATPPRYEKVAICGRNNRRSTSLGGPTGHGRASPGRHIRVAADRQAARQGVTPHRVRSARRGRRLSPRPSCSGWSRARPRRAVRRHAANSSSIRRSAGLDAVERRQCAAEDVVEAAVLARPLHRHDVHRLLDHADDGAVPTCVCADVQSFSSVRFPHSRQNRTRALTSSIALRQLEGVLGPRGEEVERKSLRAATPDPGELVSWATRFSTAGLSTAGA